MKSGLRTISWKYATFLPPSGPLVRLVDVERMLDQRSNPEGDGRVPFLTFYRAEYPGAVRLAHALTGSAEAAEDAAQDAFGRILGRMDLLENPRGYLRATVVNLCRDEERRRRREQKMMAKYRVDVVAPLGAVEMGDVLFCLPYRQRAVLVLRYWGDWSEAEIADVLGCRPGTVKTLASRGLARLRREISS
jgi:DNA-directed RNA polymerase specialized sigma24 family protein